MAKNDYESMDRLNNHWDKIVRGAPVQPGEQDGSLSFVVRQLHAIDDVPGPDSAFAGQLWQKLAVQPLPAISGVEKPASKRRWPSFNGPRGPWWPVARYAVAFSVVILWLVVFMTVTKQPLQTPTVVAFEPDMVRGVPVQSPITIQFNTAMDRSSVEKAFRVTPDVQGKLSWQGNSLIFAPAAPGFKRGTTYTVLVDNSAHSSQQQPLPSPFEASFVAADNLAVLAVQPFRDSVEVGDDAVISVQFNNPVVALTVAGAAQPDPLVITPAVEGKGKWLTTAVYTFRPTAGLSPSTQYTVTVRKGITDTTGGALAADYTWSFKTWTPTVTSVSPAADSQFVWTGGTITTTFNQPVDRASLQAKFHLAGEDGREIGGSFSWPSEDTAVFKPGRQLDRAARYTAKIDAGVLGAKGGLGMAKEFAWRFATVDVPRVTGMFPQNGAKISGIGQPVTFEFNQPMDRDSVLEHIEITPGPERKAGGWSSSDTQLRIGSVITQPSTSYRVVLKPGALDRFGQPLAQGAVIEFETMPREPAAMLRFPGRTVTLGPSGAPYAIVSGVNIDAVKLTLSKLDLAPFISADANPWQKQEPLKGEFLREWTVPTKGELNVDKVVSTTLSLADGKPGLPPGLYMVQVDTGRPSSQAPQGLIVVSRAVVTLKATSAEALIWVADQVTGQPVKDAKVTLFDQNNQTLSSGKTDASGLLFAKFSALKQGQRIYAVSEKDGDTAIASTSWDYPSGISPYSFGVPYRFSGPDYGVALYTDRPIYRPGDKVYYKGVVRADDDGKYTVLPISKQATIVIRDPRYRVVFSQTVSLNDFGSFNGELALESEAPTGNYMLQVNMDGPFDPNRYSLETYSASFMVAEFRKPDFEVKLETDESEYIQGDEVEVTVRAGYFFGAPLAGAGVKWQVFQKPYSFTGPKDTAGGTYSFSDYSTESSLPQFMPGPKPIASGEGKTDAAGMLTFRLRADIAKETMGQIFTFEATATDTNNQEVSGRTEAVVHKGTFYAGVRPNPRVVVAGKPAGIELLTVDTKAITVPNKLVNLQLFEQKWYSVQEKGPDGRLAWTSKVESTLVGSATATTDAAGKATAALTPPRAGSYKVLATASDERGNEVRSSTGIYASGREYVYWRVENHDRIELIADKETYRAGETAKVLVPSPFPKAKALLTVERGHIIDHKLIDIESTSQIVEIPVESAHVPNVFVSIVLLRPESEGAGKADFKVGYVELPVQADEKRLTISITPDKTKYQPRETATYKIKTTNHEGKPVQAELSLALVDASILSLAGENVREMFDSFYGRRSLSVSTGQTLAKSLNKFDPAAFGFGKGGGGEPGDARGYFPDVAYWNAALRTDKNGEATVSITLPDTLTTWRLTARGTTLDTIVGTQRNDIVVSKQVLIRPVVPRFFTMGDEARLEAIVHNNTQDTLEADVTLSAQGVTLDSQAAQKVKVAPAGSTKVAWTAKVGKDKQARLNFEVAPLSPAGAPKDAVAATLPILTYSTPEIAATSGEVNRTRTEEIALPTGIDREMGELTLKVEPSLAAGMEDGLKYLQAFPYECVEQTVSRFLPNIVTLRALNKLGIDNAELRKKLPELVSLAVQRLYSAQNPDGSWGWWPGDEGSPFITAYALYGLNEAKREGFAVQPQVMEQASSYLLSSLTKSRDVYAPENPNLRAYILFVLAETGKYDNSTTIALYERRDSLGNYGRAYLAMALFKLNGGTVDSRIKNLVEDLSSSALASATGVHWEEAGNDFKTMNTNNRTTSIVLDALVRVDPNNPLIPGTVRWLMVSRGEGHWETTQETAMAVIALTNFLATTGELDPAYSYELAVNNKKVGGDKVSKVNVNTESIFTIPLSSLLVEEANKLRMDRYPSPGEQAVRGKLYYSLFLRYFLPAQNIEAKSEGIVVSREYLDAEDRPVKEVPLGSTVRVKLTIVASQDLHYAIVEDPLPAGFEAVDPALKTTSISARPKEPANWRDAALQKSQGITEPEPLPRVYRDRWLPTHIDIRDEKVAFFATFMPKGTYEYTYLARATTAGSYQALPLTAYEMYFPEVWGRSAGSIFVVKP